MISPPPSAIAEHMCLGDAGSKFQDCMGQTELAHLLEHLTVEIMNETGLAGGISSGRTRGVMGDDRLFDVEISCPDDALAVLVGSLRGEAAAGAGAGAGSGAVANGAECGAEDFGPIDTEGASVVAHDDVEGAVFGGAAAGAGTAANGDECGAEDFCTIDTEGASVIALDDVEGAVFCGAADE